MFQKNAKNKFWLRNASGVIENIKRIYFYFFILIAFLQVSSRCKFLFHNPLKSYPSFLPCRKDFVLKKRQKSIVE